MRKNVKRLFAGALAATLAIGSTTSVYAAEKDTVKITVNDVPGGAISVRYAGESGHTVYLPIGEETEVPCGAKLTISTSGMSYTTGEETKITSYVDELWFNDEPVYPGNTHQIYVYEDLEIDATFRGEEVTQSTETSAKGTEISFIFENEEASTSYGIMSADDFKKMPIRLYDYDTEEIVELENLTFDIFYVDYEDESGYADYINSPFEINDDGILELESDAELENGVYTIEGECSYVPTDEDEYEMDYMEFSIEVCVGACVEIKLPRAIYQKNEDSEVWEVKSGLTDYMYLNTVEGLTYGDVYEMYLERYEEEWNFEGDYDSEYEDLGSFCKIAGFDTIALGTFDETDGSIGNCMDELVSDDVSTGNLHVEKYLISEDYNIPELDTLGDDAYIIHLDEYEEGWIHVDGNWYYNEGTKLRRNDTFTCRAYHDSTSQCKEKLYVDYNGILVTNTVMKDVLFKNRWYRFDNDGHMTEYTGLAEENGIAFSVVNGRLNGGIEAVVEPETVIEAAMLAHTAYDKQNVLSGESMRMVADALTSGLSKVDPSDIKRAMVPYLEKVYKKAYSEIEVEETEGLSIRYGGLAGAGISSEDMEEDDASIRYEAKWLGTSSNAQENLSLKLYVNDEEKTELNSKIQVRVELPETYLASNSNATMDDEAVEAVDVDMEDGLLCFWTSRLGTFEIFGESDDEADVPGTDDDDDETDVPGTDDDDDETDEPGTDDDDDETDEPGTDDDDDETDVPGTDEDDDEVDVPGTDNDQEEEPEVDDEENTSNKNSGSSSSKNNKTNVSVSSTASDEKVESGAWIQAEKGWMFKLEDGSAPTNRWARLAWGNGHSWYHFDESGLMTTGWLKSNGIWYYLHPIADGSQGHMYTGWNQINGQWYYMNPTEGATQGALLTGWQFINEKWYYFSEVKDYTEGMMLSNTTTPDGYQVGIDGAWIQ